MQKILFLLLLLCTLSSRAQQAAAVDSMKRALASAKTTEERIANLDVLSRTLMNVNLKEADEYGNQLIGLAEESRDRKLMIKAYLSNGTRCGYFAAVQPEYATRSIDFLNKALNMAKQNRMDEEACAALLKLSNVYLTISDKDKALDYANRASTIVTSLKNDSLKSEAYNSSANVYLVRNDKTMALRNYLSALRIAEETKNASLTRNSYLYLSTFYASIGEYDKAIDYHMLAHKKLEQMQEKNVPYQRANDLNNIGKLYSYKKNYDIAINYFKRSLAMADSLKFTSMKVPAYLSLLNQYMQMDQPQKALEFFNSADGQELRNMLARLDFTWAIDQAYAVIYTNINKFDSAAWYFNKATPFFEKSQNEVMKLSFYAQLADLHEKTGETNKAIDLYLRVKEIADKAGQLESAEAAARHLDTLYRKTGDFQQASRFNSIYYKYKDSLEKINKEKELAQIEAADEQYRQNKLAEELAEKKRRKNNIQYLGITIGIAALFIMLVVLGMFKVSVRTIRAIGFFAFLMFFEFIFLIFKKSIFAITEGEPWKDLAFMIALAALLIPLHHWLEHKVIKYLTSHNRLTRSGKNLLSKVFIRKKPVDEGSKT